MFQERTIHGTWEGHKNDFVGGTSGGAKNGMGSGLSEGEKHGDGTGAWRAPGPRRAGARAVGHHQEWRSLGGMV